MSRSVLYMSMSLDGFIAGPNDEPGNPGGDDFMRLHQWYGFALDAGPTAETTNGSGIGKQFLDESTRPARSSPAAIPWSRSITGAATTTTVFQSSCPATGRRERRSRTTHW